MNTRVIGTIHLNIEFASDFRVKGWALDIPAGKFPHSLMVRTEDGSTYSIPQRMLSIRPDVAAELGSDPAAATGFDINLLDLLNTRAHDYSLTFNDELVWTRADYLQSLKYCDFLEPRKLTQQFGTRQVVVVYEKGQFLHKCLLAIHSWNPNYFEKGFQSGTSFLFCDLNEFGAFKDRLMAQRENSLCFVEQGIYKQAFTVSPTLLTGAKVILLDDQISTASDFNGLMSTMLALSGIVTNGRHDPRSICALFTAVAAYANLLFDNSTSLYSFQSGTPAEWMKSCMRGIVQGKATEDIVVLSEEPIRRLADLDPSRCAVFVRTTSLRYLLTVLDNDPREFVQHALKRGCRVRVLLEGDNI